MLKVDSILLLMKKKKHTQHQQCYNDKVAYIKHTTFMNRTNKTDVTQINERFLDFPLTLNDCLWLIINGKKIQ